MTTKESCFRQEIVLDIFEVERYLTSLGYKVSAEDDLFEMWPSYLSDGQHNDSYWKLYRHWIRTESGQTWWDTICEKLELDPSKRILFWVSW